MKLKEFKFLFPNADMRYFTESDGSVVFNKMDDIEEPVFWENVASVEHLNLAFLEFTDYVMEKHGFLQRHKKMKEFKVDPSSYLIPKFISKPVKWSLRNYEFTDDIILKLQDINFNNFRIYVSSKDFFVLQDTLPDFGNVTSIDFKDEKNPYCLSLKAMYVLSYLGGVSLQNLKSENPLAKSLAYFYFYYLLKKFYNYRNFSGYDTSPVEKIPWSLYSWKHHFVWYHSQIHYSPQTLKRTKDEVVSNKLKYDTRGSKRDVSKDYLKLISTSGKGLTKVGQLLLQESNQAYVYCVLGAQAKTQWKIIGDGANSLQTQRLFKTLVDEVVAQNNLDTLIKSMRLAITQTKVRLDFVISPGLEILPRNMLYIEDSPGYNNVLRISSKNLKFGENSSVNTSKKLRSKDDSEENNKKPVETSLIPVHQATSNNAPIIFSGFLVAILGRLLWIVL